MTAKKQTQSQHNEDLDTRVSSLEIQFQEVVIPTLRSIQSTQTDVLKAVSSTQQQIDRFRYVDQKELGLYKEFVERRYATKEDGRPMRTLFWAIITAMILGLVGLMFFLIQRAIEK